MECQRLDDEGKKCKRKAIYIEHYHGDNEIYEDKLSWVEIYVCGHHRHSQPESENYIGKITQ